MIVARLQVLQNQFKAYTLSKHILIETVDRIQGLTVDLCIFELTEASMFGYETERFNLATS